MLSEYFRISMKEETQYRFYFFSKIFCNMIPTLVTCFVWLAVYNNSEVNEIAGIQRDNMIGYILLTNIVYTFIEINRLDISSEIQNGTICNYLIKPMNYLVYKTVRYVSSIMVNGVAYVIPVILLFFYYKVNYTQVMIFLLLLIQAIIINILITFCLSGLTFWFFDVSSLFYLLNFVLNFFAGTLVPINLLPQFLQKIQRYLPFKNMGYEVSASIFINTNKEAALISIVQGSVWIVILFALMKVMWKKGKERYEAYGG